MGLSRPGAGPTRFVVSWLVLILLVPIGTSPILGQEGESVGAVADQSQIGGSWSGTWTRHDTDESGGFTLTIGTNDDGSPYATFLGQAAVFVSASSNSVTMTMEPAAECAGARLRFYFVDGEPASGEYSTYGSGDACSRTGTYTFEHASEANDEDCAPFDGRPGMTVVGCTVLIDTLPGQVLSLTPDDLPPWIYPMLATVGDIAACIGPPDTLISGDQSVLFNGRPIVRMGDRTAHGGVVVTGDPRLIINGKPAARVADVHVCPMVNPGPVAHVGGPILANGREEDDADESSAEEQ